MSYRQVGLCVWALAIFPLAEPTAAQNPPGVVILLPQKLVAGQRATLAVLDAEGRMAPRAVVAFSGGEHVVTDATGRFTFTAPAQPGVLLARSPEFGTSASATVLAPLPHQPDGVQVSDYPRIVSVFDRFTVDGSGFRSEADANRVLLGDQPALVLASSPISLVLMPGPRTLAGPTQLLIEVGGRSPGPLPVTLVSLTLSASQKRLAPGEKGKLVVRVHGTERRLGIEVRNLTPEVVELLRGNPQRVISSGGEANAAEIDLWGVRAGDFSLSARIVPGAAGLPDVEAARQQLLAARRLATGHWPARVDGVLRRMERDPQDVPRVRDDLEKMLAEHPSGDFGRLLETAWRILLKL